MPKGDPGLLAFHSERHIGHTTEVITWGSSALSISQEKVLVQRQMEERVIPSAVPSSLYFDSFSTAVLYPDRSEKILNRVLGAEQMGIVKQSLPLFKKTS